MPEPKTTSKTPRRPGAVLSEALEERHMSQAEVCTRMGRSRKLINEIIKDKAHIAPETAFQLEMVLDIPAAEWSELEASYQDHQIRRRHREELSQQLDWLDELPLRAMIDARWIEQRATRLEQAQHLLRWFGVATPADWRAVYQAPLEAIRRSPSGFESDPGALASWFRAGEKQAAEMDTPAYDRKSFLQALRQIRGLTRERPEVWQDRMIELSISSGVALAFARELPGVKVAGASRWISPKKALIQLSMFHRTDADMWFTFYHEAAHILLHGRKMVFVEGYAEGKPSRDDVLEEVEADHFAANFLVPTAALEELRPLRGSGKLRKPAIRAFAKQQGVTPGIVATRLQHLGWIGPKEHDSLKNLMGWAPPGTYANV